MTKQLLSELHDLSIFAEIRHKCQAAVWIEEQILKIENKEREETLSARLEEWDREPSMFAKSNKLSLDPQLRNYRILT